MKEIVSINGRNSRFWPNMMH